MDERTRKELNDKRTQLLQEREKIDRKIAAIAEVLELDFTDRTEPNVKSTKGIPKSNNSIPAYGNVARHVRSAVDGLPPIFSTADLRTSLLQAGQSVSDNSLQSAIKRLLKQQYIRFVRRGKGRKPSTFRKVRGADATKS